MSLFAYLQDVLVGVSSIRLHAHGFPGPQMTAAADGTGSQGSVVFDDPTGTLTVQGWQRFVVDEADCTAAPRLFTGLIYDRTERRGPYRIAGGREIDTTLNDQNAYLGLRLITGMDGNRKAETDTERIAWLLGSDYLSGLVYDLGLVAGADRDFDATNYIGQYPGDVLNDLVGPRGQIFFAYWDQVAEAVGLFYDSPTSVAHTSTLTISNVLSDVDNVTCFAPLFDPEQYITPEDVYSRVRYTKKGGSIVRNNTTTATTFFPAPLLNRGLQVTNERVGLRSTAETFAARILEQDSTERRTVTVTVRLPSTHVGLIDAGHRISVRFSHLTGFTAFAYTRVERRSIVQTEGNPLSYDLTLTLSNHGASSPSGGGDPGDFPHEPGEAGSLVQSATKVSGAALDPAIDDPVDGHALFLWLTERGIATYPSTPSGWTSVATAKNTSVFGDNYYARLVTRTASGDTAAGVNLLITAVEIDATFMEWSGAAFGASVSASDQGTTTGSTLTCGGAITPSAANAIVVGCGIFGTFDASSVTPGSGVTELADFQFPGPNAPGNWVGYKTLTTAVSTTVGGAIAGRSEFGGVTFTLLPDASTAEPPLPGSAVPPAVLSPAPDGVTRDYTTANPFASGSLRIEFNGVELDPGIDFVEIDGSCGDFRFTNPPPIGAEIVYWHQGA